MGFTFIEDVTKKNGAGLYYYTDLITSKDIGLANEDAMVFWGTYTTCFKGPYTAFASFNIQFRWGGDPDLWFGFKLNKLIEGYNSGQVARRWLNLMLKNSPNYILPITGYGGAPDTLHSIPPTSSFMKDLLSATLK